MIAQQLKNHFDQLGRHLPTLPEGVDYLLPFAEYPESYYIFHCFLDKYYQDTHTRTLLLGINPGRFGGGITNVAFTDPWHLEQECGIANNFDKKKELSAIFVWRAIHSLGGPQVFFRHFFVNSVCPWGFVKSGRNYNYYDEKPLQHAVQPLIIQHLEGLLSTGINADIVYLLGEGKNVTYFKKLNQEHKYFKEVVALPHPRYILQYKRKLEEQYLAQYVKVLEGITS